MRIGVVSYDFDPPIGGLGVIAKQTKDAFANLFPSDTIVALSPSPNADDRVSMLASMRWRKSGGCPLFSMALIFTLPSLIRKHHLGLLHVHSGSGGVFLLRKPACSLVVTAHHTYLQEAEIVFAGSPAKKFWKQLMACLEKRTYILADRVVCVSQDTADFLADRYDVPRSKLTVIENAVASVHASHVRKRDVNTILFIGRLEERKGIWTLLQAFERLRISHPSARLRLVGRNLLGARLEAYLKKKNLSSAVTVLGHVHEPLMKRELACATLLVVPSLLEGFGLVAADALMCGTCVIVSDAPGLRSIVRDHETGLVFKTGDAADCAGVLSKALDHSELRQKLSEKGREDALKRFSIDDRARDLHGIFSSVIREKHQHE